MIKLRIGGVPEHFNLPWRELAESRELAAAGIELDWRDYGAGTGALVAALEAGELDAALLLTEGAVAGLAGGGRFSILSRYTRTPLIWGIHVPAGADVERVADLEGRRFAISRHGSGSHLMVYALARREDWPADALEFVTVGGLDGAVEAFREGRADVFLWERFMTEPVVRHGHFRRVADFVAPWPAFVVAAADAILAAEPLAVERAVDAALARAAALKQSPDAVERIARGYGLDPQQVERWLERTEWAPRAGIETAHVEPAVALLKTAGLIDPAARIAVGARG